MSQNKSSRGVHVDLGEEHARAIDTLTFLGFGRKSEAIRDAFAAWWNRNCKAVEREAKEKAEKMLGK